MGLSLRSKHFCVVSEQRKIVWKMALVLWFMCPKPKIPFLGLSLLRNCEETLATQAKS